MYKITRKNNTSMCTMQYLKNMLLLLKCLQYDASVGQDDLKLNLKTSDEARKPCPKSITCVHKHPVRLASVQSLLKGSL